MHETGKPSKLTLSEINNWRDRLALRLGVSPERKHEIYLELSKSTSLRDPNYWLQLLFAAGIATLGLVLDSPAVIIGAMLISPLMGPILAGGLSFAAGDFILGLRAGFMLFLSCVTAIAFSILLVGWLPFKEITGEIAARTQPTTLDLVVALFSGAIGSIAICKETKGVVTSIPGVAIAVALMPPLCVMGYGFGVAVSLDGAEGLRVARGGGLLFLTNLVAITFMAMITFLVLHIDTDVVREKVREWRRGDQESVVARYLLQRSRITPRIRNIGGLPGRLLMAVISISLLLIPLSQSLGQLNREITRQQQENMVRRAATQIWQKYFEKSPGGEARSFLDSISVLDIDGTLTLNLRVFDAQPYAETEKANYTQLVAERLGRPAERVKLQLVEIPTAAALLAVKAREERRPAAPPTVAQLRTTFQEGIGRAMQGVRLPPSIELIEYRVTTGASDFWGVEISYLGDHQIGTDAEALIAGELRTRFAAPEMMVRFEWVASSFGPLVFRRNQGTLPVNASSLLDQVVLTLQKHARLRVEIVAQSEPGERENMAAARIQVIGEYLRERGGIAADRITTAIGAEAGQNAALRLVKAVN